MELDHLHMEVIIASVEEPHRVQNCDPGLLSLPHQARRLVKPGIQFQASSTTRRFSEWSYIGVVGVFNKLR
ncbi:unnamed protein product [Linum trigynum]|uniref:Uncharacterized protein n=1 Tax=Linum trigynum TaxID=586398 RepID=A0AAV2DBK0_9ROSI